MNALQFNYKRFRFNVVFLLVLLAASVGTLFAQQDVTVSGTVSDAKGETLPGVNVVVKGTGTGTVTDFDGKFSLPVPNRSAVLQFSYIGFTPLEVAVGTQTSLAIVLQEDSKLIDEVVVVGYGTQKKINLTGSVESLEGKRLSAQPVAQASQALMGLAPGLTVIQESGQPGLDEAKLRIRGLGSISASNDPLILIDGVEGSLSSLDMGDIENISVLKDASSAAIYGARASNGVILVTTKRAKEGDVTVNYRNYLGFQSPTNLPKYLGALDYLKYSGAEQAYIDNYRSNMGTNPDRYPDTDWVDLLFSESGFQQYHNVNVSGGSDKAKVSASLGFTDQNGNVKGFGYKRYNGRLNSDLKLSKMVDMNFDLHFNRAEQDASVYNLVYVMQDAFRLPPVYPYRYSDGSWADGFSGGNPISRVNAGGYNDRNTNSFKGILKVNIRPVEGLVLSAMYAPSYEDIYDKYMSKTFEQVIDPDAGSIRKVNDPNQFKQTNSRPFTQSFNAVANYTKTIGAHDFGALAGYEFVIYEYEQFMSGRQGYVLQQYEVIDAGSAELDFNSGTATHTGLVSYFGRINYGYKNRYLFEANIRRDASSRFNASNRVGVFPSFSFGWRLSEEAFMKKLPFISNLKLRASWGALGNQYIAQESAYVSSSDINSINAYFPYAASIRLGNSNYMLGNKIVTGATQEIMANKDVKWETTEVTNFGIDAGVFNQRLSFNFDYYIRHTKDILLNIPVPAVIGLKSPMQNVGDVENKGWDLSLNWQDKVGEVAYGVRFNLSDVKNEVTDLNGAKSIINGNMISPLGSSIGQIYGFETVGVFQTDEEAAAAPAQYGALKAGNLQYRDQLTVDTNNDGIADATDGKINADDWVPIGNPFPRMTYGADVNASWKGFDASVAFQGVGKRDVFLTGDMVLPLYNAGKIQEWHTRECWTPERPDARFPKLAPTSVGGNDNQVSSTWVFDGSYLRIRNITFGYTFPKQWLEKAYVKNLRVYLSGQNLFTFDNLPEGIDPLVPNGSAGATYPVTKNYSFGLELSF